MFRSAFAIAMAALSSAAWAGDDPDFTEGKRLWDANKFTEAEAPLSRYELKLKTYDNRADYMLAVVYCRTGRADLGRQLFAALLARPEASHGELYEAATKELQEQCPHREVSHTIEHDKPNPEVKENDRARVPQ